LLLFVYALGMALPLFLLALSWERIGPWARPRVTVISGAMLIALGALFIVFQGSNALAGIYESLRASDLSAELETALGSALRSSGELVTAGLVLGAIVAVLVAVAWRLRRRPIASRLAAASGASDVARTDAIEWIEPST
jgi:cytochrome c biogenesis protein CcdA